MPPFWRRWVNFKETFVDAYGVRKTSPLEMMQELNIPMDGLQHGGIDACRNLGKLIKRAIWDGKKLQENSEA